MYWFWSRKKSEPPVNGLILPGGGARNAYQVGVLKAIAEVLPEDARNPFPVICGTSSGAINAAILAGHAANFRAGVAYLENIWRNFRVDMVFDAHTGKALKTGLRWAWSVFTGGRGGEQPHSLLDPAPLRESLDRYVQFERIRQALDDGHLRALGVTTFGYSTGRSITFYQATPDVQDWARTRRRGIRTEIGFDHLLASSAIPLVFPAVEIDNEYFGDGSMRETSPLSPAIHLGANRLLIIGARPPRDDPANGANGAAAYPSVAKITGYVFDTLFLDSLDADLERMNRINHTISQTRSGEAGHSDGRLRPIDFLMVAPSVDLREYVQRHVGLFPKSVRLLLRGLGALTREGRPLMSYLLFEGPYCRDLIDLGYADAMAQRAQLEQLVVV